MKSYVTGSQWDSNPDVKVQCLNLRQAMEANPSPLVVPLPPSSTPGGILRASPGTRLEYDHPWEYVSVELCRHVQIHVCGRVSQGEGRVRSGHPHGYCFQQGCQRGA